MKIATFGWTNPPLSQIERINSGLIELGHEISYENPDLIFSNNPTYEIPLDFATKCPFAKLIFNVLDYPLHVTDYPFQELRNQLIRAHAITTISRNTQSELLKYLNLKSTVIYNPIKKIHRNPEISKDIFCLYVGRNGDGNKRFNLVVETLQRLKISPENFIVCGPEAPSWGTYYGIVSDEILNDLYNRAKYYICPTLIAGLELPPIEASFAGCIPIYCNDNPTAYELFEHFFITDPNPAALANKITEIEKVRLDISQYFIQTSPMRYLKLSGLEVAKAIVNCYNHL